MRKWYGKNYFEKLQNLRLRKAKRCVRELEVCMWFGICFYLIGLEVQLLYSSLPKCVLSQFSPIKEKWNCFVKLRRLTTIAKFQSASDSFNFGHQAAMLSARWDFSIYLDPIALKFLRRCSKRVLQKMSAQSDKKTLQAATASPCLLSAKFGFFICFHVDFLLAFVSFPQPNHTMGSQCGGVLLCPHNHIYVRTQSHAHTTK